MLTGLPTAEPAQPGETGLVFKRRIPASPQLRNRELFPDMPEAMSETLVFDALPARAPVGAMEGMVLGRYRIVRKLGAGATGTVYLGEDVGGGPGAAIKIMALPAGGAEQQEMRTRFFHEADMARRLAHPGIVAVLDAGELCGLAYIAMELLDGGNLTPFLKPGRLLPLPVALSIGARVADILAHVHARQLVHRDIKPANIMWDPVADRVKLADFGIAQSAATPAERPRRGTPAYMSPEQVCGHDISSASDLFSLGVTLYQLCCGSPPFHGSTLPQLMHAIATEPHAGPGVRNPGLPVSVTEIVDRALAKRPQDRHGSADEMALALRRCLAEIAPARAPGVRDGRSPW